MKASLSSLLLAGSLGAGLGGGYALHSVLRGPASRAELARLESVEKTLVSREAEVEALRKALRAAEARIAELEREREAALAAAEAEPAAEPEESVPGSAGARALPIALASPAEADAVLDAALERHDIQALFDLAATLLQMGEPGYEKLIEVFERLLAKLEDGGDHLRAGFETQLNLGPLARALATDHDAILRFSLHLLRKDPESLSRGGKQLRKVLAEEELANVLLGLRDTVDPEVDRGFLDAFRQRVAENPDESVIRGLAYLDAPEATEVLASMVETSKPELLPHIVAALGFRKDPRALPTLEMLRGNLEPGKDPGLERAIEAAIRSSR